MQRVAVISDIHAQAKPLERVLKQIKRQRVDSIWCLGDFASGGPDPVECYEQVLGSCDIVLGGNHELFVVGQIWKHSSASWAMQAEEASIKLGAERVSSLASLSSIVDGPHLQLAHASLRDPLWEFIDTQEIAEAQFPFMIRPFLIFGHTHAPAHWTASGRMALRPGEPSKLSGSALLNPGAVCNGGSWMLLQLDHDMPASATWMPSDARS